MRFGLVLTAALVISLCGFASADGEQERTWYVGFAEADITPSQQTQVHMTGFGNERYARGVLAPLLTQVVALRDQDSNIGLLITADVLDFDRVTVEAIRRKIFRKHGITPENIMIAASHTHGGPTMRFCMSLAMGGPNVWYMARLEEKILSCVNAALQNRVPALVEYGWFNFRGIGCNRRLPKDGEITWAPYREGSFDEHTPILQIRREGGQHSILIVGHACHPTSSGLIENWSPDYPGAMRDYLDRKLPNTKAVFVQGCGGDAKVVHEDPDTGRLVFSTAPERAREAGEKLARAVLKYLETGRMTPIEARLTCGLASGQISYGERWSQEELEERAYSGPTLSEETGSWLTWTARHSLALPNQSQSFRYDVQVWKVGELTILGMEGEVCSPWGPALRSMASTEKAMVIAYANSTSSYIPNSRIVREGGYEGLISQHAYFLPGPFTEEIDSEIRQIVAEALVKVK
jgi:hypothetical protein